MASSSKPPRDREAAFVAMFDANYAKVLSYARRRLGPDAADEAVADTFLTAWNNLDRAPEDPLVWLYGIARGAVANHRRRVHRAARLDERARAGPAAPERPDPADTAVWKSSYAAAVARLSETDREALRLALWEGLTSAEAASVLGCSPTAYKVRLHRARQRLRRLLQADVPSRDRPPKADDAAPPPGPAGPDPAAPEEGPCQ